MVLVGLAVGWRLSDPQFHQYLLRRNHVAVLVTFVEAPLTFLVYLRLATLASVCGARRVGKTLLSAAFATPALMVAPPVAFYLLRGLPRRRFDTDLAHLVTGVYVVVALAVALLAASALLQLMVVLMQGHRTSPGTFPAARAAAAPA